MGAAAVAVIAGMGIGFRSVLHERAQANAIRIADMFTAFTQQRLTALTFEARSLASELATRLPHGGTTDVPSAALRFDLPGAYDHSPSNESALCAWAVYDPQGQRVLGRHWRRGSEELTALGLCTPKLVPREQGRLASALSGATTVVLVPSHNANAQEDRLQSAGDRETETAHQGKGYALHYAPISREGRIVAALQAVTEVAHPAFAHGGRATGTRIAVRPFAHCSAPPHQVAIDGVPHLVVQRALEHQQRQLGSVTVAVEFKDAVRYDQGTILAIVAVVLASIVVLTAISWMLTATPASCTDNSRCQTQATDGRPSENQAEPSAHTPDPPPHTQHADESPQEPMGTFPANELESLADSIAPVDAPLAAHAQRVAAVACALARELDWDDTQIEHLRFGALLHDLGKTPATQPQPSTSRRPDEQPDPHDHPFTGAQMLAHLPSCEDVVRTIMYHHECYDGTGFPTRTRGDAIPPQARLVAIADAYDHLTTDHPASPPAEAIARLRQQATTCFDPHLVEALARLLNTGCVPTPQAHPVVPVPADRQILPMLPSVAEIDLTEVRQA